jgi:phosphatidylserine/phosphatidylglycerophosphate/cardiolipin synthase-like enzyme
MTLTIQPDAGIAPVLQAIKKARKSVDIVIFRLDITEVVDALAAAVARGLAVRALVAHTNRGGEKTLRKLEMRMLETGVTVSRSSEEVVRYHGKMMIIDGRVLHVHGFNCTRLDVDKSRSFGIATTRRKLVQEATKLFQLDCDRQPYSSSCEHLVVSPENSRARLAEFIKGAKRQLLIYDPEASDPRMLRLLADRVKAGVDVRIIGKTTASSLGRNTQITSCGRVSSRQPGVRGEPEPSGSSSTVGARWASSSATRRSSARWRTCSRPTGRGPPLASSPSTQTSWTCRPRPRCPPESSCHSHHRASHRLLCSPRPWPWTSTH